MLQKIREGSQGWVAKTIVAAIIVTFALFGAESLFSYFGSSSDDAASVNGESISQQAVEIQVQRAIRSGQVPAEQEREYRGQVLSQLIRQRVLNQYAEDGGLHLSDDQLDQLIVTLPEFQDEQGRFDSDLFTSRLRQAGYTPTSFRRELRSDSLRRQVQEGLANASFVLPSEVQRLTALNQQQRSFRYATLSAADLAEPVNPQSEDLQSYYNEHQDDFRRPEQVRVAYVVLNQSDLADSIDISEDELRQAYQQESLEAPREASHILATFGDNRTEDEARERLEEAQSQLADGADFATLAEEYSDDGSSASRGGAIGSVRMGDFGDPFDSTVFSLESGEVSQIVKSEFGLHLIKVTGVDLPSFEDERDALTQRLRVERSRDAFNEKAQQLADAAYGSDDLQSVADELQLTLNESDWFAEAQGGDGVLASPDTVAAAFSSEVLEDGYNSDVVETDDQQRVVLRVLDHREASVQPLEEVRDQVQDAVRTQMTQQRVSELAEERLASLKAGEAVDSLDWQQADTVSRDAESVPQSVLQRVFQLPRPDGDNVVWSQTSSPESVTLIGLESVQAGNGEDQSSEGQSGDLERRLAQRIQAQNAILSLSTTLEENADIERR